MGLVDPLRGDQQGHEVRFTLRTRGPVMDPAGGRGRGAAFASPLDPPDERRPGIAELLERRAGAGEGAGRPVAGGQSRQGADEAAAVEATEGALNRVLMPR